MNKIRIVPPSAFPLQQAIQPYVTPFLFAEENMQGEVTAIGGTALLLETSKGRFLITAAHVWREFERKSRLPGGRMTVAVPNGGVFLSLRDSKVITESHELDIAVLKSANLDAVKFGAKRFYHSETWPLQPAVHEETIGFIGYPGTIRQIHGMAFDCSSWYLEHACVVGSSGSYLIPGETHGHKRTLVSHVSTPPLLFDIGGCSGAPVFAYRKSQPVLVGIVTGGTEGMGPDSTFQVSSLRNLKEDGLI